MYAITIPRLGSNEWNNHVDDFDGKIYQRSSSIGCSNWHAKSGFRRLTLAYEFHVERIEIFCGHHLDINCNHNFEPFAFMQICGAERKYACRSYTMCG